MAPHKAKADSLTAELKAQRDALEALASQGSSATTAAKAKAEAEAESLRLQLAEAQVQLSAATAAAAAAATATAASSEAGGAGEGAGLRVDELKALMSDIYDKASEVFVPSDGSAAGLQYAPADVIKKLKKVLKEVLGGGGAR